MIEMAAATMLAICDSVRELPASASRSVVSTW